MQSKVHLNIDIREPFADGMEFEGSGAYERLSGSVRFEIDPSEDANKSVVDLDLAPRNDAGLVEYATDFYMLMPVDMSKGNSRLIYDVNNRGNMRMLQFMNDAVAVNTPSKPEHAGNGFLMRQGYTMVWSGWQGDLLTDQGLLAMDLPIATQNGAEITGVTRMEYIADAPGVKCVPLSSNSYTLRYEAASLDTMDATFTKREYEGDTRIPISSDDWSFAQIDPNGRVTPSSTHCYLEAGFDSGWIYELVYTAKNPSVLGLGFTGLRDLISFLRYSDEDADGVANPLRQNGSEIEKAYSWGRSQSGRFLRELVYRGYNVDESGRRVFDAISPHVSGGGRIALNYRFAQPGRYSRQHADHLYPTDAFPFAYDVTTDALTGKTDGILKRPETDPIVLHTQTSSEYWERRGSLVHTDSRGNDLG